MKKKLVLLQKTVKRNLFPSLKLFIAFCMVFACSFQYPDFGIRVFAEGYDNGLRFVTAKEYQYAYGIPVLTASEETEEVVVLDNPVILPETTAAEENTTEGRVVYFQRMPVLPGLAQRYVKDYYAIDWLNGERSFTVIMRKRSRDGFLYPVKGIFPEVESIKTILEQDRDFLPRIWQFDQNDRRLLDDSELIWTSSDEEVIGIEDGLPVLRSTGVALLHGTKDEYSLEIAVEVCDTPETEGFDTVSDEPYYIACGEDEESFIVFKDTVLWPMAEAKHNKDTVTVPGNRIYQFGSYYYYAEEDFEVNWKDAVGSVSAYSDHLIRLSQGLPIHPEANLSSLVSGALYAKDGTCWIYTGYNPESAVLPDESDSDWINLSDSLETISNYDPGADTGPESDAAFYFESQYNPYPGTISSNCTYAVWALANQALGVRLPNWGDAGNWYRRAGISGYQTGQTPAPMSIIVWDHHVGFVTAVSEDGTMIYIKEGNFSKTYHEGWWPVAPSRHGQKLYGFIYLTDDTGAAFNAQTVVVSEGFEGTEEEFLKVLAELNLEPGTRSEAYSDAVKAGDILSYVTGELPVGSVVDYTVSLGEEIAEVVIDSDVENKLVGKSKQDLLLWLSENELAPGTETVVESEQEDGTVLAITKGTYEEGDRVNYTVAKKKEPVLPDSPDLPEEEPAVSPDTDPVPSSDPTEEPAAPTSDTVPQETPESEPETTPEPSPESTPETTPEPSVSAESTESSEQKESNSEEPVTEGEGNGEGSN